MFTKQDETFYAPQASLYIDEEKAKQRYRHSYILYPTSYIQRGSAALNDKEINEYFTKCIDEYSDMITRICMLMLGNMIDAQDAYLAVFEKLFIRLKKDPPEEADKWLAKVAYNECNSMLRFKRRHRFLSLDDISEPFKNDEDIAFMELVFSLPEKYRNVLYLYYNKGYSTAEIAAITGKRENTVRTQLKRARDKLKRVLDERNDERSEPE
ncbi:MAG: sigma-70 family RNA polymerase sigma factor [Ruminococcus sp.]|nr:sigma-70 family RNA polymerase sigma factor [Ruminococcus sp.]